MVANPEGESSDETVNYKGQYRNLKRKLKFLIYENECFQEALRTTQRRLLKASRDRSFLLDRLLQYEKVELSSSGSEETESSDEGEIMRVEASKRRKLDMPNNSFSVMGQFSGGSSKHHGSVKKKKSTPKAPKPNSIQQAVQTAVPTLLSDGHMTPEEVERHLESRQSYLELVPEKAPPTVPTEMFSNEPSLDSESNELGEIETSPSNMGEDCLSVDIPE